MKMIFPSICSDQKGLKVERRKGKVGKVLGQCEVATWRARLCRSQYQRFGRSWSRMLGWSCSFRYKPQSVNRSLSARLSASLLFSSCYNKKYIYLSFSSFLFFFSFFILQFLFLLMTKTYDFLSVRFFKI
jgi:hypothetical protein